MALNKYRPDRKNIIAGQCKGCPEVDFCCDTRKPHQYKWCMKKAQKKVPDPDAKEIIKARWKIK